MSLREFQKVTKYPQLKVIPSRRTAGAVFPTQLILPEVIKTTTTTLLTMIHSRWYLVPSFTVIVSGNWLNDTANLSLSHPKTGW